MRHHYVPQFLLGAWSERAPDHRLHEFRLDLPGLPAFKRVPKATGYQTDLYALSRAEVAGMKKQALETILLRGIDNEAARVRQKMLRLGLENLNAAERSDWVRFLTSLRVRQPDIVSKLRMEGSEHLRVTLSSQPEEYELLAQSPDLPTLGAWVADKYPGLIENFGLGIFKDLILNEDVCQKLFRLWWWQYDFDQGKYDLLLADNPSIWAGGIDAPDFALALPISPRKAFLATRSEAVARLIRSHTPRSLAIRLNYASILQTRARVYSRTTKPRAFIAKCLAQKSSMRKET